MASPPISIKLRCTSWKQLAAIYERDLTRNAVFLKSAAPPPVGTRVRINLTLPTQTLIVLNGSVDRHIGPGEMGGRGPGVDIKLHNVPQSAMWLIESALESARREGTGGAPARSPIAPAPPPSPAGVPPAKPAGVTAPAPGWIGPDDDDADINAGERFMEAEEDLIAALSQELTSLRKLNPFQILGVGYETLDQEVRAAFAALTKRYHPDRFARYESNEAKRIASEIFILIRDAYQRLDNPGTRAKLIAALDKQRATKAGSQAPGQPSSAVIDQLLVPPTGKTVVAEAAQHSTARPASQAVPPPIPGSAPGAGPVPPPIPGSAPAPPPIPGSAPEPAGQPAEQPAAPPAETSGGGQPDEDDTHTIFPLLDQDRYDEARKLFKLAVRRNPSDREARIGLELAEGLYALSQRDRLESAQRFEAVLELDPNNERAARELAEMRRQATNERKNLLTRLMEKKD